MQYTKQRKTVALGEVFIDLWWGLMHYNHILRYTTIILYAKT